MKKQISQSSNQANMSSDIQTPVSKNHLILLFHILVFFVLISAPTLVIGQSSVSNTVVLQEGVTTTSAVSGLSVGQKLQSTSYVDGLGRNIQSVLWQASPNQKDMVSPAQYDHRGRMAKNYLPYASTETNGNYKSNALNSTYSSSDQYQFYQNAAYVSHDTQPFAETLFEASVLSNPIEQGAFGSTWNATSTDRTIRTDFRVNTASEVRKFTLSSGLPAMGSYYSAGLLSVSEIQDEDNNLTLVYRDKLGRTLLKKIENGSNDLLTYFVYDNKDQVAFIIPPKESKAILDGATVNTTFTNDRLYKYTYDERGRMITREVPDGGEERFVYDHLDRLVLTQTAEQRTSNEWSYIKYDMLGRVVFTGVYTSSQTPTQLQEEADPEDYTPGTDTQDLVSNSYSSSVDYRATKSVTLQPGFQFAASPGNTLNISVRASSVQMHENGVYYDASFPDVSNGERHSENYYDTYDFNWDGTSDVTFNTVHNAQFSSVPQPVYTVRGRLTKTVTRVLGSATLLESFLFYDEKGRVIQVQAENHKGGTDIVTIAYDFAGKMTKAVSTFNNPAASETVTVVRRIEYDHVGRPENVYHKVDAEAEILLCSYTYNELGELIDKKVHSEDAGTTFLQSTDFRYNIRGWLTSINNASLTSDAGVTNDDTDDLFGMELLYDNSAAGYKRYNGSIGEVRWSDARNNDTKSYRYEYDAANRLTDATYGLNGSYTTNMYGVSNIGYDLNGNITGLQRKGKVDNAAQTVDNLSYTYVNNQLESVNDITSYTEGFNDRSETSDEYDYDANGNMIKDLNKGISSISYNHLDLAEQVNFSDGRKVQYYYNAGGLLLTEETYDASATLIKTKDFIGDQVYEDDVLVMLRTEEGHIIMDGTAPEYQYNLTDQQGNTRVTITSEPQTFEYLATMETENEGVEEQVFTNMDATRVPMANANHTPGGNEAARVNSSTPVGPTIAFYVAPGDEVDLEVYAYYDGGSGYSSTMSVSAIIGALTATASPATALEGLGVTTISDGIDDAITAMGVAGSSNDNIPAGYLNYILFDMDFNYQSAGYQPLSSAANGSTELLSLNGIPTITQEGYMVVYVSNESNSANYVHFDDLKVTHEHTSPVVQQQDYYPFGLAYDQYQRTGALTNPYLYNRGSRLEEETEWYSTSFRKYDASIGRFTGIDALADQMAGINGYQYGFNNPISFNDPTGLSPNGNDPKSKAMANAGAAPNQIQFGRGATPGSGNYWSDGSNYSDWSPNGGSEMYRRGLAAGLSDFGGNLGKVNPDGSFEVAIEKNGRLGFYEDLGESYWSGKPYWKDGRILWHKTFNKVATFVSYSEEDQSSWDPVVTGADYLAHGIGVSGNLTLLGGAWFDVGIIYTNDRRDWSFYASVGPSLGLDVSIGIEGKTITARNRSERFQLSQYQGYGASDNVGLGFIDFTVGGDYVTYDEGGGIFGAFDYGESYIETAGGGSWSLLPVAYTRQTGYTWVFGGTQ